MCTYVHDIFDGEAYSMSCSTAEQFFTRVCGQQSGTPQERQATEQNMQILITLTVARRLANATRYSETKEKDKTQKTLGRSSKQHLGGSNIQQCGYNVTPHHRVSRCKGLVSDK